jgi:glycosyltransferase involved in cell wall biosynthesis
VRILHLSKFYPPDPGGLEYVVAALAEGAAKRGHEVTVVCATGSSWAGKWCTDAPEFSPNGVRIFRVCTFGMLSSQPLAPAYLKTSRIPADVVYTHRPHPLADLALLFERRRPVIVFHHSDVQRQRLAGALVRPLARSVARRATAAVLATQSHLRQANDLGPAGQAKTRIIPFGIDENVFFPLADSPRPPVFPDAKRGAVGLFVGRLVPYKGLDVLLRAVEGTDLRVVIVGDGPLRQSLGEEISRRGLGRQAILVGRVSQADLPSYYQAADYFVFPSTTPAEMFGISLIESMGCATPVITTALESGVREVNEKGLTGLEVPPGDAFSLRSAMLRLAGDPDLRKEMGMAGRRRVEERFTLDRMVDAHLELCEEVATGASRGG